MTRLQPLRPLAVLLAAGAVAAPAATAPLAGGDAALAAACGIGVSLRRRQARSVA